MKPFNLEAAKNGAPVCTRDGRKARILCFDYHSKYPIVALFCYGDNDNSVEGIGEYDERGKCHTKGHGINYDLMMASTKHEGWVNVYRSDVTGRYMLGDIFESEKQAKLNTHSTEYIATVKIEWEE